MNAVILMTTGPMSSCRYKYEKLLLNVCLSQTRGFSKVVLSKCHVQLVCSSLPAVRHTVNKHVLRCISYIVNVGGWVWRAMTWRHVSRHRPPPPPRLCEKGNCAINTKQNTEQCHLKLWKLLLEKKRLIFTKHCVMFEILEKLVPLATIE